MIKAKKSLGQNFLIDREILEKIVNTTAIRDKNILEVGPGTGNLTSFILKNNPKKMFVIEKDDDLAKNLNVQEKTILKLVKKIKVSGIPISISSDTDGMKAVQASMNEPISWIIKEKEAAEVMLELIGDLSMNGNEEINNQKNILYRIYDEYVTNLNEAFDKWNSLRLFEQLSENNK